MSGKRNCLFFNWKLRMKGWGPQPFKMESIYPRKFFLVKLLKIVTGDTGAGREMELGSWHISCYPCSLFLPG